MKTLLTTIWLMAAAVHAETWQEWISTQQTRDSLELVKLANARPVTNYSPAVTSASPAAVWGSFIGQGWTSIVQAAGMNASDRTNPPAVVAKLAAWITNTPNLGTRAQRQIYASEFMREIPNRIDGSTPDPAETVLVVTPPAPQFGQSAAQRILARFATVEDMETR